MHHLRLKRWLAAAAAVLGGLAAALYCHLTPQIWEVRATVLAEGAAAQAVPSLVGSVQFTGHIRELTDFSGQLAASAIPGTHLVVLTARDAVPAHASAGLSAALDRLDAMMPWVGECAIEPLILSDPAALPTAGNAEICLAGALAGGILAVLLLFPLPKRQEPLDFADLFRLAKRRLGGLLLLCLLLGGGNYFREKHSDPPVSAATILVSVGTYSQDTAKTLTDSVCALVHSDLMTVPGITAQPVGQSNLFLLTATAETPEKARDALTAAMALWPELAVYGTQNLDLVPRQPMEITAPQPFRPLAAWGKGLLLGAALWAALLFLHLVTEPQILTPPPPKRIINPKVKEGSP